MIVSAKRADASMRPEDRLIHFSEPSRSRKLVSGYSTCSNFATANDCRPLFGEKSGLFNDMASFAALARIAVSERPQASAIERVGVPALACLRIRDVGFSR